MKRYLQLLCLGIIAAVALCVSVSAAEVASGTYPVSNIRFETVGGEVQLCWDAPACEGCTYQVSFTEYGGGFWEKWYSGAATSTKALNPYKPMATRGIRVQTLLSGAVVGETVNDAMRVEIQEAYLYLGVSGMVQVEADGCLTYQVTGLLPNAKTSFNLRTYGGKSYYSINPSTNGEGILGYTDRFSGKTAANTNLSDLYADINLYTDPVVSSDGMTFSYTRTRPMNLIQLVEGDIPEEGEGETAEGESAVSNVRFEMMEERPYLCWDAPEGVIGASYNVFLSEDGGETWENWENGVAFAQLDIFENPWGRDANAVRVETVVNGEVLGTFTDINVALSEQQKAGFNWVYGTVKKDTYPYFHAQIEGLEPGCYAWLSFRSVTGRVLRSVFVKADEKGIWSGLVDQQDAVIQLENLYITAESFGNAQITEEGKALEYTRFSHGDEDKLEYDRPPKVWVEDVPTLPEECFYLTVSPGMIYGTFQVPAGYDQDAEYTLYFYNSENMTMAPGMIMGLESGTTVALDFISTRADRVRIYETRPDDSYVDVMPVGEAILEKPIIEEWNAFPFPHEEIEGVSVKQGENSYLYTFKGLDCAQYTYSLYNPELHSQRMVTSEQFLSFPDWIGEKMDMTAVLLEETADAYRIYYSETENVRVAQGFGSYCPLKDRPVVIPDVGQNGYDFAVDLGKEYPVISLVVPGERDDEEGYCLILYSSVRDCEYLTLYFNEWMTEWSLVQYQAGKLDRGRVLKGTNTSYKDPDAVVLADWELEKPIVTVENDFGLPGGMALEVYQETEYGTRYKLTDADEEYTYTAFEPKDRVLMQVDSTSLMTFHISEDSDSDHVEIFASCVEEKEDRYEIRLSDRAVLYYDGTPSEPTRAGTSVSGTVSGGEGAEVTLVRNGETVEKIALEEDAFYISAESGTYDVVITKAGCLTWKFRDVILRNGGVTLPEVEMLGGDVNSDTMINIMDMGFFRADFGKVGANIKNTYTDVNSDGMVNIMDMGTFRKNFGKTTAKDCTVVYQGE